MPIQVTITVSEDAQHDQQSLSVVAKGPNRRVGIVEQHSVQNRIGNGSA